MSSVKILWGQSIIKKAAFYSEKITFYLSLLFIFLLPWQTRYIFSYGIINGDPWEYGTKSLYGTEILAGGIIVFFILSQIVNIKEILTKKRSFYWYCVIGLCGCLGVGFLIAAYRGVNPGISYYYSYRFFLGLSICLVISKIFLTIRHAPIKLLTAFWISGVIQGLLALSQFFSQHVVADKWLGLAEQQGSTLGTAVIELSSGRWLRAYGAFGWPNSLGIYLAIAWVIGLLLYQQITSSYPQLSLKKIIFAKAVLTGGQMIITSGLILSFSRGSWIAAGIGAITLLILIGKKNSSQLKSIFFQLLYSGAVIIFFFIALHPLFVTRFDGGNRLEQRSVTERVGQWKQAYQTILHHPLTGVGPGAITYYFHVQQPMLHIWDIQPVHAIYVLVLAEDGFLIAILYALICILFIKHIWKHNRLYLSVIMVMLISGLFDHWLMSLYGGMMVWWVVWGIGPQTPKVKVWIKG